GQAPQSVIADVLTPAIQRLGDAYGRGDVFLPQLIAAADAMKAAVARAKAHLPEGSAEHEGRVVFGTVKGDIHSIGKDICVSMLESQGYLVDDLGVDVPAEAFAEAATQADAVCLSALMTTTLPNMERAIGAIREARAIPVLVGGAVVTRDFAEGLGAGYSEDAPGCVSAVRDAIARNRESGE
ncbi:MAG: cobalamin-dependent protein, partial [Coriobacteriia bacterium]